MEGFKESARKYTEHELIRAHVTLPKFPELRSRVLAAFLKYAAEHAPHPKLQEAIGLAVSLMQHGLDTHELVEPGGDNRRRQMAVLAGDYFSSRFYQLMSQEGSVQTIRLISQAVCEVNRLKVNMYMKAKRLLLTAEEYLRTRVDMDTLLFTAFTPWLDAAHRKACPAVLRAFAECELLADELERLPPHAGNKGWAYWFVLEHGTAEEAELVMRGKPDDARWQKILLKYNLIGRLTDRWEARVAELNSLLRSLGSDKLAEELHRLAEPRFAARQATAAPEIRKVASA